MYGEDTEEEAWVAVTEKIVELLPRSKGYTPSLSPCHQVEMTGMQIIQRVVAQRGNIFDNVAMASAQSSAIDLTYRGAQVQVKAALKTWRNKYRFHLHHGKSGHHRPYDVGIAFIYSS
jgi:hypothetical protein